MMTPETINAAALPLMSEEEFLAWCDEDTRAELVDGRVLIMPPASLIHYDVNSFIGALLRLNLELRPHGHVLGPEIAVRTRSQFFRVPDLLYLDKSHASRIKRTHVVGAPDAVWEIISPDSEERDWRDKLPEYEQAGIREYWILNPYVETVYLYSRDEQGSYQRVPETEGVLRSTVIPDFWLRTSWLWQKPLPGVLTCLREMGVFNG